MHTLDAEFEQHYLSTEIEYHGRKRSLLIMFRDQTEPIEIPSPLPVTITGELHEGRLDEPLTLVDSKFI